MRKFLFWVDIALIWKRLSFFIENNWSMCVAVVILVFGTCFQGYITASKFYTLIRKAHWIIQIQIGEYFKVPRVLCCPRINLAFACYKPFKCKWFTCSIGVYKLYMQEYNNIAYILLTTVYDNHMKFKKK